MHDFWSDACNREETFSDLWGKKQLADRKIIFQFFFTLDNEKLLYFLEASDKKVNFAALEGQ